MKLFVSSFVTKPHVEPAVTVFSPPIDLSPLLTFCSIDWAKSAEQLAKPPHMHFIYLSIYFYGDVI